jgi:hypothetical protein
MKAKTSKDGVVQPTEKSQRIKSALPDFVAQAMDRDGFFRHRLGVCFSQRVDRRFGESQIHLKRSTIVDGYQRYRVHEPGEAED